MNAQEQEFGDIDTDVMALLTFTHPSIASTTLMTTVSSSSIIEGDQTTIPSEIMQHWGPPEPYNKEEVEEGEEAVLMNESPLNQLNENSETKVVKSKKKKNRKQKKKKKSNTKRPNPFNNNQRLHIKKKAKVDLFAFDVCKVNENGVRPGRIVLLTKERVFHEQSLSIQWRVEDLTSKDRLRPKRFLNLQDEEDYTWFEKECHLIKECA